MNPDNLVITSLTAGGLFGTVTTKLHKRLTTDVYNSNYPIFKPAFSVSIILPAFNEEEYIHRSLSSLLQQNILYKYKDYFELIVVDNESTDKTAEIAKSYNVQVITAPRGKLNARHLGIIRASGEIIVAVDADCYYPPNYINLITRHFQDNDVVAVEGQFLSEGNFLIQIGSVWINSLKPLPHSLRGACSAFSKSAYLKTGGFNLLTNQFDIVDIMSEEEVVLYENLLTLGKIIFDKNVICFHPQRGVHGTVAKEYRLEGQRAKEIAEGQRF